MYISMLKNREQEQKFLKEYGGLYKTMEIMPLIEIIHLKIGKKAATIEDLIDYNDRFIDSLYFIDFFMFSEGKYNSVDYSKVEFPLSIRTESKEAYLEKLLITTRSNKAIPVISIKKEKNATGQNESIKFLINNLQEVKPIIAVRIEASLFTRFYEVIKKHLRPSDFLFFDINEDSIDPYVLNINELQEGKFNKILTYSPRHRQLNNGSYSNCEYSNLVDCFAAAIYKETGFEGYADYAGLKDELPKVGYGKGGTALAMLYNHNKNQYYTIANENKTEGAAGYAYVINILFQENIKNELDGNNCRAYDFITKTFINRKIHGGWAQWNYVTILRTLSEIKKNYS